jgi:hypothetical protein
MWFGILNEIRNMNLYGYEYIRDRGLCVDIYAEVLRRLLLVLKGGMS